MRRSAGFALGLIAALPVAAWAVEFKPPAVLTSRVSIVPKDEPGTPLVVTGRVVDGRGRPRAGIVMGVYQTDARGYYGKNTVDAPIARLHGWLKTDSLGRYEVRTIRPGGPLPHIHFIVNDRSEELRFAPEGKGVDGVIDWMNPRSRDTFALERPVRKDRQGVEHMVRDFHLR